MQSLLLLLLLQVLRSSSALLPSCSGRQAQSPAAATLQTLQEQAAQPAPLLNQASRAVEHALKRSQGLLRATRMDSKP
jgi:hypothetical protein